MNSPQRELTGPPAAATIFR